MQVNLSKNHNNITNMVAPTLNFAARHQNIFPGFKEAAKEILTGYWQIYPENEPMFQLAVVQGRIVFCHQEKLSLNSLWESLKRYRWQLRQNSVQEEFEQLKKKIPQEQVIPLSKILVEMEKLKFLKYDEARDILKTKILVDLESYLFDFTGKLYFLVDLDLMISSPLHGFEFHEIFNEIIKRKEQWQKLSDGLSLKTTFTLNKDFIYKSELSNTQKTVLQSLLSEDKNLEKISIIMGKDPLETAKVFNYLIKKNLIFVNNYQNNIPQLGQVLLIDDSVVFTQQFCYLLNSWGYETTYVNNPMMAVETILQSRPKVVFLDINMPEISGFEAIKQIRRQPELASIPLVLLTGEKTIANQWRAQWAHCKFLTKPRSFEENSEFQRELQKLLQEIIPATNN